MPGRKRDEGGAKPGLLFDPRQQFEQAGLGQMFEHVAREECVERFVPGIRGVGRDVRIVRDADSAAQHFWTCGRQSTRRTAAEVENASRHRPAVVLKEGPVQREPDPPGVTEEGPLRVELAVESRELLLDPRIRIHADLRSKLFRPGGRCPGLPDADPIPARRLLLGTRLNPTLLCHFNAPARR